MIRKDENTMKKQVHINGTLLSKLEPGKPAMVKLEDNSMMRTSSVIRYVGDSDRVWFETQNTWYCLKYSEKRILNRRLESIAVPVNDHGHNNQAASCKMKAV